MLIARVAVRPCADKMKAEPWGKSCNRANARNAEKEMQTANTGRSGRGSRKPSREPALAVCN